MNESYKTSLIRSSENEKKLYVLNRSAAKAKLPAEKLIAELKSSLCWKEDTLSVIKHVWNEQVRM